MAIVKVVLAIAASVLFLTVSTADEPPELNEVISKPTFEALILLMIIGIYPLISVIEKSVFDILTVVFAATDACVQV